MDIACIRYSGIQKTKRFFTLRISYAYHAKCTSFYSYLNETREREREREREKERERERERKQQQNIARPSESRPTEKMYFRSVPYNHTLSIYL